MGNLPILWIFGLFVTGYAISCARSGYDRGVKTAPVHVGITVIAGALLAMRIFLKEPLVIYLIGEIVCAIASFHFSYIGQSGEDDF